MARMTMMIAMIITIKMGANDCNYGNKDHDGDDSKCGQR